jgi:pimeloyl-ACP methyl ester carboxylesterase
VLISSLCLGREIAFWVRLFSIPELVRFLGQMFSGMMKAARWVVKKLNAVEFKLPSIPAVFQVGQNISNFHQQNLVLASRLGDVNVPTLLVWGGRDPIVPVSHAYSAAKVIPDCQVKVFKNRGHNVHRDELKAFSSILNGFLG